ncbi:MAG: hypothetical protein AAFU77_10540 [Myxococcota bacterium]
MANPAEQIGFRYLVHCDCVIERLASECLQPPYLMKPRNPSRATAPIIVMVVQARRPQIQAVLYPD